MAAVLPVAVVGGSPLDEIPAFEPFILVPCRDADVLRRLRPVEDPLPGQRRMLETLAIFQASPPNAPHVREPLTARMSRQQPGDAVAGIVVRQTAVEAKTVPFHDLVGPPPLLSGRLLVCRSTVTAPPTAVINPKPQAPTAPQTPSAFARLKTSFPVFASPLAAVRLQPGPPSGALSFRTVALHVESSGGGLSPVTINPRTQASTAPQTPSAFARLKTLFPEFASPLAAVRLQPGPPSGALSFRTVALHVESSGGGLPPLRPSPSSPLAPPASPLFAFVPATMAALTPSFPVLAVTVRLAAFFLESPATAPFTLSTGTAFRIASCESASARDAFGVVRLRLSSIEPVPRACFSLTPLLDETAYFRRIGAMLLESLVSGVRSGKLNPRIPEFRADLLRGLVDQPFTRQAYDLFACLCETVRGSGERRRVTALREWVAEQHLPGADSLVLYYCSLHAYENGATDLALSLADDYLASAGANRARARLLQAMCHVRVNHFDEARRTLTDASVTQAGDDLAAEATFLLGWIDFQQGRTAQARATLGKVVSKYPKAPAAQRARNALANLADGKEQ